MLRKFPFRKIIVYLVYILLFSCFQVSFPGTISFHGQIADLTFVFVVLTGYFFGFGDAAVVGIITGLIRDSFASPAVMSLDGTVQVTAGLGILVLFLAGAAGSSFFTQKMHRNLPFAFLAVIFLTFCYKVIGNLLEFFWIKILAGGVYNVTPMSCLTDSIIPQVMLNFLASIPIIFLLKFMGPYRRGGNDKKDDVIKAYGDSSWLRI